MKSWASRSIAAGLLAVLTTPVFGQTVSVRINRSEGSTWTQGDQDAHNMFLQQSAEQNHQILVMPEVSPGETTVTGGGEALACSNKCSSADLEKMRNHCRSTWDSDYVAYNCGRSNVVAGWIYGASYDLDSYCTPSSNIDSKGRTISLSLVYNIQLHEPDGSCN